MCKLLCPAHDNGNSNVIWMPSAEHCEYVNHSILPLRVSCSLVLQSS
jgi:hypothetical protein